MQYGDLVSVIVPIYNRAHAIPRSIGSICSQSYQNLEILLVDDCSTDDVELAVESLGDHRVKLIKRDVNGGASAARNSGLEAAKGDIVAFMDSDDISVFDRIEQEVKLLCTLPKDYIGVHCCSITHVKTNESNRGLAAADVMPPADRQKLSGRLFEECLKGNFINLPTMLVKKTAAISAGPFDERIRNNVDWDFTLRLVQLGKFGFVPQPLYLAEYLPRSADRNDHVSQNARYSALSYSYITGKLRRAGHSGPDLARHYIATGSYLMRTGRPIFARHYFYAAIRLAPKNPKLFAHIILSYAPQLHHWVSGHTTRN